MDMKRTLRARLVSVCSVAALAIGMTVVFTGVASADSASDPRATFVPQEGPTVTTCEGAGLPADDLIIGADGNGSDDDDNLSGEVVENAGDIQPGTGEELNVTIESDANVVIDGVVVKGGNGYNLYSDPSVLPPALDPPQHYIAPLTGGGKVPGISHWFVCYHLAASISVEKKIIPLASGVTGVTLPDSYSAEVVCDDGTDVVVTLPGAGGVGTPSSISVADGAVCTVTETTPVLSGQSVTYDPAEANTTGVTADIDTPVTVTITNDFSAVKGESVVAPVTPASPVVAAARFTG
jgi:hypothetical protein